jgi:ubiquinone biosynthesis protein
MTLLSLLTRKGRHRFARYRQILSTLVAYGFDEVVYQSGLGRFLRFLRRPFRGKRQREAQMHTEELNTWVRIRLAVEQLGPTFIKLGQILSNRPDLVPRPLQRELSRLQEDVPPFPSHEAAAVIQRELGQQVGDLFREFDETPVAAASIAQIHRAVLPRGEVVAVKVQRPGLDELVQVDVAILKELADLVERHIPETRPVAPRDVAEEFESGILQELDFRREAAAIERFAAQFEGDDEVKVPRVHRQYSSRRILTMEFIEGRPVADYLEGSTSPEDGARIARIGADLTLKQIFTHGFFHADPHPGNLLVLDDGRLCYLDFGLTGNLIQRDREVFSDMLISVLGRNEQKAAKAVIRLAGSRDYQTAQNIEREIAELIHRFQSAKAGDFSFTSLLAELMAVLVDEGLRLPTDLFLLVKALITIEGVATGLDPHFDFAAQLEPFAASLVRERYGPERVRSKVFTTAEEYAELVQNLPGDYYRIVDALSRKQVRLALDERSFRPVRRTVLQAASALVSAIVLGSLIVGSSLIVHAKVPPLWNGVSVIGIVGFIAAGLVGLGLLVKMLRTSWL